MSTKMRVLLSFEFNDVEPGSEDEEWIVSTIEKLALDMSTSSLPSDPTSVSVHDVQFYSTDIGGWV